MSKYIHISACFNPWVNLAIDQLLFQHAQHKQPMLFLWQNQKTVVIGRNQNAWKECRTALLESEGGKLARRPSGGGAVFHDMGNLCFTFVCEQAEYDVAKHWQIIHNALISLGIPCETSGRNDLTVQGRKFSGSAFAFQNHRALHHGTLMVDVDMEQMTKYLSVSKEKIQAKGVDSVRSRVINLRELMPELNMEILQEALIEAFCDMVGIGLHERDVKVWNEEDVLATPEGKNAYERYADWDWRYGASPVGDVELEKRFGWGGVQLVLTAKDGRVADARVYSDALNTEYIDGIANCLWGVELSREGLKAGVMKQMEISAEMTDDLAQWLAQCDI